MGLDYLSIGLRLKHLRSEKHVSQEQLAEKTGLSRSYISYVESGSKSVGLEAIVSIANAMKVSIEELLMDNIDVTNSMNLNEMSYILLDCTPEEAEILTRSMRNLRKILRDYTIKKS